MTGINTFTDGCSIIGELPEKYLKKVFCEKYSVINKNGVDEVFHLANNEDCLIVEKEYRIIIQDKEYITLTLDDDDTKYLSYGQVYMFTDYDADFIRINNYYNKDYSKIFVNNENIKVLKNRNKKLIENCQNISTNPNEIFKRFLSKCDLFEKTGAVHNVLFFSSDFKNEIFFSDLARHNCIIKGAGYLLLNNTKIDGCFLSCRVNTEIIGLVDKIGITNIYTKASVTYDAINFAKKNNIKLYGYVKENRWTEFS